MDRTADKSSTRSLDVSRGLVTMCAGSFLFAASFFQTALSRYPDFVVGLLGKEVYTGWSAFLVCLQSGGLGTGLALTNLVMAAVLLLSIGGLNKPELAVARYSMLGCSLLNLSWLRYGSDLQIGYYAWAVSFFVVTAGLFDWSGKVREAA